MHAEPVKRTGVVSSDRLISRGQTDAHPLMDSIRAVIKPNWAILHPSVVSARAVLRIGREIGLMEREWPKSDQDECAVEAVIYSVGRPLAWPTRRKARRAARDPSAVLALGILSACTAAVVNWSVPHRSRTLARIPVRVDGVGGVRGETAIGGSDPRFE